MPGQIKLIFLLLLNYFNLNKLLLGKKKELIRVNIYRKTKENDSFQKKDLEKISFRKQLDRVKAISYIRNLVTYVRSLYNISLLVL